jgi:LmbE family N-acetylglucosaminyl deacetylase
MLNKYCSCFILSFLAIVTGHLLKAQTSSVDIYEGLKKLNVLGSVLYIAAHPDDENNTLLPYLAKEKMYRTAYLSLTRGDGGQNLIGPEQGVELGMIRTQELIAARKIDGCEQYFTSAYEFGYSKSVDETFNFWNKQKVLYDAVYVIRKFQPDIIIARFPPDKRAGHGHHAASAVIAEEAFYAAANPNMFPEQLKNGITTWQAKRLLWNTYNFGSNNTTAANQLQLEVGMYNALIGKSYGEIGGEARTMHKSQGEGRPRRKGSITEYFTLVAGDTTYADIMEGINTTWSRLQQPNLTNRVNSIIQQYNFEQPQASVPLLVSIYKQVQQLPSSVWKNQKLTELQEIIFNVAALVIEATTNTEEVVQGDTLTVSFFANNRTNIPVQLNAVKVQSFDSVLQLNLKLNTNYSFSKKIRVNVATDISQPYWLKYPKTEGMFVVEADSLLFLPDNLHRLYAHFTVDVAGVTFSFNKPIWYKTVHPVRGELYEPLAVLPAQEIFFDKENYIALNGQFVQPKIIKKQYNYSTKSYTETEELFFIDSLKNQNFQKKVVSAPGVSKQVIYYPHIPKLTWFKTASANIVKVDAVVKGKYIGYIPGAGDKLPEALEALGYVVETINENNFTLSYLKKFDAIVVGIRAHNIHEYLTGKNEVLNAYIHNGGNVIVQYIRSNVVNGKTIKLGAYSFVPNSQARVTNENAKVTFINPNHVVLNYPNKITQQDFEHWIQERSTYQAEQRAKEWQPILLMNDEGENGTDGSLLIAPYGKGNIVYCSLALFRQLPAGVAGAYRLLANFIALPKNK